MLRAWLNRRIAARGRLSSRFRLAAYGPGELAREPHAPLADRVQPWACACGLALDDPVHGRAGRAAADLLRGKNILRGEGRHG